ncbi:leucine-rich repeat protein 1-like isoform X1 [Octopus sinensis]|uniref:Leucine-rich repeat protein 1-like isoform X1 n=2 Tax=Octopus sinensis TaxID=2607531 RepID=A0A7E6EW59_9MOLL|nr:leucine-rich repeat protein 1-like isoform X1 [Octopus sinensis]XP_036359578.1 leucine-rich repeat protein 1-like isoform X1 [Octopus sinensis]
MVKMRLQCDMEISNRALPSHNLKSSGRCSRGYLSIGQNPGSTNKQRTVYIMLCTAKDKTGTKYVVKDNVEKVFCNFISEGKTTIRFKEPQVDLHISKADSIQLKSFLTVLKASLKGECPQQKSNLSTLSAITPKQIENSKKKLTILKRQDYPILKGFPFSLVSLKIIGCHIKKLDSRIPSLKYLQHLDLADNVLQELPEAFSRILLTDLILKGNQFSNFPQILLEPPLCDNLTVLDLSSNQLQRLPSHIDNLRKLQILKVSRNQLKQLPINIGNLSSLKNLDISNNQLPLLPANFIKLCLHELDLSHNSFSTTPHRILRQCLELPSLQSICVKFIINNKIPYCETMYRDLHELIRSHKRCWCGKVVVAKFIHCIYHASISFMVASLLSTSEKTFPLEAYFCSQKCFDRFTQKQFQSPLVT